MNSKFGNTYKKIIPIDTKREMTKIRGYLITSINFSLLFISSSKISTKECIDSYIFPFSNQARIILKTYLNILADTNYYFITSINFSIYTLDKLSIPLSINSLLYLYKGDSFAILNLENLDVRILLSLIEKKR